MARKLDTSMLDGGDTPGPRPTPLVLKVVDRFARRERCDKHCHCVTAMGVKVSAMFYLLLICLGYFIPRELYGWMRLRDVGQAPIVSSSAEVNAIDRQPSRPARDAGSP